MISPSTCTIIKEVRGEGRQNAACLEETVTALNQRVPPPRPLDADSVPCPSQWWSTPAGTPSAVEVSVWVPVRVYERAVPSSKSMGMEAAVWLG